MSRLRRAVVNAGFGYAQFGISIVSGLILVPLTLHELGARAWGLWLATGELLGYAGMIDLGVLGVLPWMLAEADGRRDRGAMRRLVGDGVWMGALIGIAYVAIAWLLWQVLPSALRLSPDDRQVIQGPLAILILVNGAVYPLRVFRGVLAGLQDVRFNGVLAIVQSALTVALTAILLMTGSRIYALALASALPFAITAVVSVVRTAVIAPDLLRGWGRPSLRGFRPLLSNGWGVWLAGIGWQLLSASNSVVLTFLGHPEWAVVYACTSKLTSMCTQLAWIPPDSALVPLAQLYGEHTGPARLRGVVITLLRLHLLLSGAAACALLAVNPAFVTAWVGAAFFAGVPLNILLTIGIVVYSLVHGLITTASVLGNRTQVGIVVVVNGLVQTPLALLFGHVWGMTGIAAAGLIAAFATAVPAAVVLLGPVTGLRMRDLAVDVVGPWLSRAAAIALAAAAAGAFSASLGLVATLGIGALASLVYLWHMRPLVATMPIEPRWSVWLVRAGLLPATGSSLSRPVDAALDRA